MPEREADVDLEMLGTSLVLRQMEGANTRLNLVLLDAYRNNPFGARGMRGVSRGLAQMDAPRGTLISFTTQPGNVASDGDDGHSPYTKALAQTLPLHQSLGANTQKNPASTSSSFSRKWGLLELAKQLGNVSQACKMLGYSRDSFQA